MDVLVSIKPRYVEAIKRGEKRYEFRKRIWKDYKKPGTRIYIYSSSPTKKIIGYFVIGEIIEDSPEKIWQRTHKYAGIKKEEFISYFSSCKKGYAISIKQLKIFNNPISPKEYLPNFHPPQSFQYMTREVYSLINRSNPSH